MKKKTNNILAVILIILGISNVVSDLHFIMVSFRNEKICFL